MIKNSRLKLKRDLIFLDIEGTGTDPESDRIIEICLIKWTPEGKKEVLIERVNPGIKIPPESIAIHGIEDEHVKDKPHFRAVAAKIMDFIGKGDLGGYNIGRYDVPLLAKEMERAGIELGHAERHLVDAMKIFHKKEPRNLASAYKFYCQKDLEEAHTAQADTEAVAEVFFAQMERYEDLPDDVAAIGEYCNAKDPRFVDINGRFSWRYGAAHFNFGKYRNQSLETIAKKDPDYLIWLTEQGKLPDEPWAILREALEGRFPKKKVDS